MPRIARWIKEPFCGLSHLFGAALSVAGLVVLLVITSGRPWHVTGVAIYGASLVLLYVASTLSHSVHCSPDREKRLDRFDHAAIFLLIAGTYTPLCLVTLRGPWGWTILAVEWVLAVVGIVLVTSGVIRRQWPRVAVYVAMGWVALAAVVPLVHLLPGWAIFWMLAGGLIYTLGAVIYATDWPRLWPGRFGSHDLWHVFVLAGSACHFVMILCFIAMA
ncbi:MAG: hemolysin III family protein [Tepidisphaeraceae bacterium]